MSLAFLSSRKKNLRVHYFFFELFDSHTRTRKNRYSHDLVVDCMYRVYAFRSSASSCSSGGGNVHDLFKAEYVFSFLFCARNEKKNSKKNFLFWTTSWNLRKSTKPVCFLSTLFLHQIKTTNQKPIYGKKAHEKSLNMFCFLF